MAQICKGNVKPTQKAISKSSRHGHTLGPSCLLPRRSFTRHLLLADHCCAGLPVPEVLSPADCRPVSLTQRLQLLQPLTAHPGRALWHLFTLLRFYLQALMARVPIFCPSRWSLASVSQAEALVAPSWSFATSTSVRCFIGLPLSHSHTSSPCRKWL